MADVASGIKIPDSKVAREAAELVRQPETEMLFNHSVHVYVFGAMKGIRQNLKFDSELLYVAALFHDMGLVWLTMTSTVATHPDSLRKGRRETQIISTTTLDGRVTALIIAAIAIIGGVIWVFHGDHQTASRPQTPVTFPSYWPAHWNAQPAWQAICARKVRCSQSPMTPKRFWTA